MEYNDKIGKQLKYARSTRGFNMWFIQQTVGSFLLKFKRYRPRRVWPCPYKVELLKSKVVPNKAWNPLSKVQ